MRVSLDLPRLSPALAVLGSLVRQGSADWVRIDAAADGTVTLAATDLETSARLRLPAHHGARPGTAVLPARLLAALTRAFGSTAVTIHADAHRARVECGGAVYHLPTAEATVLPPFPEGPAAAVLRTRAHTIAALLDSVAYATAPGDTTALGGIAIERMPSGLRATAMDGHRLATRRVNAGDDPSAPAWQAIVPRSLAALLPRLFADDDPVTLFVDERALALAAEAAWIHTRLIEGPYPVVNELLATAPGQDASCPAQALRDALARAALVSDPATHAVSLSLGPDALTLTARSPLGEAREAIAAAWPAPPVTVQANARWLIEALDHLDGDEVRLGAGGPRTPIALGDRAGRALIMPLSTAP